MQRAITLTLLLSCSVGAFGTKCGAGRTHKAVLTNTFCTTSATGAASCDANCCAANENTCGGVKGGVTCLFDQYAGSNDAWKNTKTTVKTKATDCCSPKSTCGSSAYTCPAGYTKAGNAFAARKCSSDAASCAVVGSGAVTELDPKNGCCVLDLLTCGGLKKKNGAGYACADAAKQYIDETSDAWRKIAVVKDALAAKQKTNWQGTCCAAKPTCADVTGSCPAGYKANTKATAKVAVPAGTAFTDNELWKDALGAKANTVCCIADATTCGGGATPACAADKFYPGTDSWKIMPAGKCCTAKATCAVAVCSAGWKKKANVDALSCTSDRASCASAKCCEKDNTKCGGLASVSCAFGSYDERSTWTSKTLKAAQDAWNNKPATEVTKNTACCTAKAACAKPVVGTTTPATVVVQVAVTTTPAVAAVRLV